MIKGVSETIENEATEQNGGSINMLLGTLTVSLLGNMLSGKGLIMSYWGNDNGKSRTR